MRCDEQIPLAASASLRDHATHRVTSAARGFCARIGRVSVLDHSPLDLEAARAKLRGSQSLMITQITNDRPRILGRELHIVERDHATHGHLPAFWRLSLVGDALQHPGGIALMAALAIRANDRIGYGEAASRIRRWSTTARRTTTAASSAASTLRMGHAPPRKQSNDEPNAR